jgi:hypothetical protein
VLSSDDQIRDTCRHFGRERIDLSSGVSMPVYELPAELNSLPLFLFHVRRGPLLGPILQNEDDIDVCRQLFLNANRTDALRLCTPALLSFNSNGAFEELSLESLALQSNRILYLDHHTQVLIWSGADVASPTYQAYRDACIARAHTTTQHRLPAPDILMFDEYSSQARFMQARLIPSHKDDIQWQAITFPQIQQLNAQQRQALINKFLPTDECTFVQYYQQLFKR